MGCGLAGCLRRRLACCRHGQRTYLGCGLRGGLHRLHAPALSLLGVAGIYYYLSSPFLAFMQILIYIGAVCVTLVFAIMLAERSHRTQVAQKGPLVLALCTLGGSVFTATLLATTLTARWNDTPPVQTDGSLERIGESLLSTYSMSFELISVVLLVAMVGALVLAREGRDRQ